jgi:hypothetical protein
MRLCRISLPSPTKPKLPVPELVEGKFINLSIGAKEGFFKILEILHFSLRRLPMTEFGAVVMLTQEASHKVQEMINLNPNRTF